MKLFYLLLLSVVYCYADGLKILGILPFPSKSHFAIGNGILKSLSDAGHDVTVMSSYPQKDAGKNYHDVEVTKVFDIFAGDDKNPFVFGNYPTIGSVFMIAKMGGDTAELFMADEEVQRFIKEDRKFDICIFESFQVDALLGIPEKYGCHLITFATFAAVLWTDDMTGNDSPTSYVPNPLLQYTDKMEFKERLWNTAFSIMEKGIYYGYHLPRHRKLYKKYFPNARRSFDEMYKGASIIFSNTHVSSSTVRPSLPTIVEIAGIHMKPAKKLPDDIQEFLDSATDGVILFSMGSFIQSKEWPIEKRDAFVRVFGKLKQKVIWKYENETLPNNPGNIKIGSWIPQRDILAHPNVKVFITHGGLLGTTEGLVEGVPVLGLPIFGDQKMNMAKSVLRGYGLQIYFNDITEERVAEALNELLTNPKYRENAVRISKTFNDRPMTPQQSVVYWTEYVARHDGAKHLQAEGKNLSFIAFHMIDVYSVLGLISIVVLYIDYLILKAILKKIFKKKDSKQKKN